MGKKQEYYNNEFNSWNECAILIQLREQQKEKIFHLLVCFLNAHNSQG